MSNSGDKPTTSEVTSTPAEQGKIEPGLELAAAQRAAVTQTAAQREAIDVTSSPISATADKGDKMPESQVPKNLREKLESDMRRLQEHVNRLETRTMTLTTTLSQVRNLATSTSERASFLMQQLMEMQIRVERENARLKETMDTNQVNVTRLVGSDSWIRARMDSMNQRIFSIEQGNVHRDYMLQNLPQRQGHQGH